VGDLRCWPAGRVKKLVVVCFSNASAKRVRAPRGRGALRPGNLPSTWVGLPVERSPRWPRRLLEWARSYSFQYWAFLLLDPIAVALTAAGAVGLAGALMGALTKWGIPQARVEEYEQGIRAGGILMGVKPRSDEDAANLVREWQASGGELVHS
jgi:hypothetical protein